MMEYFYLGLIIFSSFIAGMFVMGLCSSGKMFDLEARINFLTARIKELAGKEGYEGIL